MKADVVPQIRHLAHGDILRTDELEQMIRLGSSPQGLFYVTYHGHSMNPILQEGDVLEVVPYGDSAPQVGDVVLFMPEAKSPAIVHRVTDISPEGIATAGDANDYPDPYLLNREQILGHALAAWRGSNQYVVRQGSAGRLRSKAASLWRRLVLAVFAPLEPFYYRLVERGILARHLPQSWRPEIIAFQSGYMRLLWRGRIIGWYDPCFGRWNIPTAFRLLIDPSALREFSSPDIEPDSAPPCIDPWISL